MSRSLVYSVFDSKVKAFSPPFTDRNHASALRGFANAAADPSSNLHKYPDDFSLMHVGEFDDELGAIRSLDAPVNLGLARSVLPVQA